VSWFPKTERSRLFVPGEVANLRLRATATVVLTGLPQAFALPLKTVFSVLSPVSTEQLQEVRDEILSGW